MNIVTCLNRLIVVGVIGAWLSMTCLHAADAPTREEWDPVMQAIAAGGDEADTQLANITNRFAKWPDGWIERARFSLTSKQPDNAWKYAREALSIQAGNGEAAALGVQALNDLGRFTDALKVAEKFRKDSSLDKQANGKSGYVNYYAAYAALSAKDPAKASDHFSVAVGCAGTAVPPEFHLLGARIAIATNDLAKAEASLTRATTADPRCWDGWYELGRVRHALAEADTGSGGKRTWLDGAVRAFSTVTKVLPDDYESWLGLGRAQAAIARLEIDAGSDGGGQLRDAVMSLQQAVKGKDDLTAGWVTLGEAQLRLEQYSDAVVSLQKARSLGVTDQSVLHNLVLALQKSGHVDESLKLLKETTNDAASDLVNQGMVYYHSHLFALAIDRLESAAAHPDLADDLKTRGQALRFAGHSWREWADAMDSDGKPLNPPATPQECALRREKAAETYRRAGDLGDRMAQRHFAALQSAGGAQTAYAAGWTVLGWNHWLSGSGWSMVIGNYGAARVWDSNLHKSIWGVLIGLPLLLWIASLFRKKTVVLAARSRPSAEPSDEKKEESPSTKPTPAPSLRPPNLSLLRTAKPAATRESNPLTTRKPRPKPPEQRLRTTEIGPTNRRVPRLGSQPGARQTPAAETEEIVPPEPATPPPKPRPKPR